MRAIVTGGAGFIGSHVVDALVARGDEVLVIDNFATGKRENLNPQAKLFEADITNLNEARKAFRDGVDTVFHLAALPKVPLSFKKPALTHRVNVDGTLNIIDLCYWTGARRLVFSSSSSVYGNQPSLPLKETMKVEPLSPYGLQKYTAEKYCRFLSGSVQIISLRYFNVYGPRSSPDDSYAAVISIFLSNAKRRIVSTIYGTGEQTRDFTHVYDVVRANLLTAESENVKGGEFMNIGGGSSYSVNQLAKMIGGSYIHQLARTGEPLHTLADISKARALLGWGPKVTLKEGIAKLKELNGLT